MDAVKFIKELKRMCDSHGDACMYCPIGQKKGLATCREYRESNPENFVILVNEWSENHKPITNRQKFLEVFGITIADAILMLNWGDKEFKEIK